VGAGAQHVAGADEQQLFLKPQQRAWAVSEQRIKPAEQTMAAVANFIMISLLAIRGGPRGAKTLAPAATAWNGCECAGRRIHRNQPPPTTYRHDAENESSPRRSGTMP
jgi:hypothetical protein